MPTPLPLLHKQCCQLCEKISSQIPQKFGRWQNIFEKKVLRKQEVCISHEEKNLFDFK
jgi:hypothetical protein